MTTTPQKPKSNGCLVGCGSIILFFIVSGILGTLIKPTAKTPEQEKQERVEMASKWYNETSSYSCERSFKEDLRKPSSYERRGDFITTSDNGDKKVVIWKFSAENGFGGTNVAGAICSISRKNGGEYNVSQIKE